MMNLPDRFMTKVIKTNSCWLWNAGLTQDGYGAYWTAGKTVPAHRYSWAFYNGPISEGLVICHRCDVPACVNPDHLFIGTHQENHADMVRKKRNARGERSGGSKLTAEQVSDIRELYQTGVHSYTTLSRKYGVTKENISCIIKNKTWRFA